MVTTRSSSSSTSKYSRDATISAVHSFYTFLTTLPKLSASSILTPPPDGWTDISATSHAILHKDATVIDLLRHLPYIREDNEGSKQISYETSAIRFNEEAVKWYLDKAKEREENGWKWSPMEALLEPAGAGIIPEYVVCLTTGKRYGSWLLCDTRAGTITDFIQQERPERKEPSQDSPDHWRAYRTLPVAEFFEEWKEKYRSLEWVAIPGNEDDGVLLQWNKETDEVRDIYRAHGWPDEFRREECRQALLEWDETP